MKNSPQNQENLAEKVVVTVTTTFKSGSDTSLPDEYKVTPMRRPPTRLKARQIRQPGTRQFLMDGKMLALYLFFTMV